MNTTLQHIGCIISGFWENGIALSNDAVHFLNSVLGITCAQDLESALGQENYSDTEMILEMIFFPDLSQREAIEAQLAPGGLKESQLDMLANFLLKTHPQIRMIFPETRSIVTIDLSLDQLTTYLVRLGLTRQIPLDIHEALNVHLPESLAVKCRTLVRNKNTQLNDQKTQDFIWFIEKLKPDTTGFIDVFELFSI